MVIRTFREPLAPEPQRIFLEALQRLCATPLNHESIGRPIDCGVKDGATYVVHTYLPGEPVDEYFATHGPRPLSDVIVRVTHLAAAIDFAAAAGVYHGAMGPRDVIFAADHTGVAGFGIMQALREAGVVTNDTTAADDVFALAAMTFELLTGERLVGESSREGLERMRGAETVRIDVLADALDAALSTDAARWPKTALQFAASLQQAQAAVPPPPVKPQRSPLTPDVGRLALGVDESGSTLTPALSAATGHGAAPVAQRELMFDAPLRDATPAVPLMAVAEQWSPGADAEPTVMLRPPVAVREIPMQRPMMLPVTDRSGWRVAAIAVGAAVVVLGALAALFFLPDARKAGTQVTGSAATLSREEVPATDPAEPAPPDAGSRAPAEPPGAVANLPEPHAVPPPPAPDVPAVTPRSTPTLSAPSDARAPAAVAGGAAGSQHVEPRSAEPGVASPPGRLLVRSNPPGALVLVDGAPRGDTPVAIRGLEFGAHTIAISAPGYPSWERRVMLTGDRPAQSFDVALADARASTSEAVSPAGANVPAAVQVDSRPSGAQVWVDGALMGTTPLLVSGVGAGSHAVRIELPGYQPWATSIQVGQGARTRVAASLER